MMAGENARPSAKAGRIRCWQALENTSKRPTSSESSSKNPVICGSGRPGATSPVNGSARSATPNTNSKIRPQRNSGIDNSRIEPRSATGSNSVPRRWNSSRPPPNPRRAAITMAASASWMVAGRVAATSDPARGGTGWSGRNRRAARRASQIRYCSGSGRSRPISRRLASISAIVAFGGSDIAAGSTGSSRSTQNSSAETISRIGIAASRRRAISLTTLRSFRHSEARPLLDRNPYSRSRYGFGQPRFARLPE